jgi:hypothetical protein
MLEMEETEEPINFIKNSSVHCDGKFEAVPRTKLERWI